MKEILKKQFDYAKKHGWIPFFVAAGKKYGFTTADLMAVSSRESNLKNIKGDFHSGEHHGFSLMQLDINSHREWIESGAWQNVEQAIDRGARALKEKRDQIVQTSKQNKAKVKFRSGKEAVFTPRAFTPAELRHMTLAAYNCGGASYYHFSIGNDIDRGTTQQNYGRDVMLRARHFADFLKQEFTSSAGQVESPAEVATDPDVDKSAPAVSSNPPTAETSPDLFETALASPRAKAASLKLWPRVAKHVSAALGWLYAFYEANKFGTIVVGLVILCGVSWLVYHNWTSLKAKVITILK